MPMNRAITLPIAFLLVACSESDYSRSDASKKIWEMLEASEHTHINFSKFGGTQWTKVCFLGPYNESSEQTLGFPWLVSEHTDVLKSDGHNVIVFATDSKIIDYVIHSRGYGDFWKLSGKCLSRENSNLTRDPKSPHWLNYIPPKA